MFETYIRGLMQVMGKIECSEKAGIILPELGVERIIAMFDGVKQTRGKIMWVGNGGSAAIASHSAADYFRTGNVKTQCFTDSSLITCMSNDFGYPEVFSRPVELYAESGDVLVAISSSGKSPNILNAVQAAREKGCIVVTLSGFNAENPLRKMGDVNFYVPSSEYGFVELTHGVLCHSFLDLFMRGRINQEEQS